ncbi:MAG: hypothetical protein ACQEVA_11020, partial [Myxococcota bacterium]
LRRAFAIVELTRPPEEPEEDEDPAAEAQRVSQDPDDYEPEKPRSPYAPPADQPDTSVENDTVAPGQANAVSETGGESEPPEEPT